MGKPYAVVFAGVPGTSKSPVAHYLSCEFGLPIFSNDQIRYEVREDLRLKDINEPGGIEEYEKRKTKRYNKLIPSKMPVILDGSMDRKWAKHKQDLAEAGYDWFMINMELTRPFLIKLFAETGRTSFAENHLDNYLEQHKKFLAEFTSDVHVQITDETFADRLNVAAEALKNFIETRSK